MSLKSNFFFLEVFAFLFFQNLFCINDGFLQDRDCVRLSQLFEYLQISSSTRMDIDQIAEPEVCEKELFDVVMKDVETISDECKQDKDGDVIMRDVKRNFSKTSLPQKINVAIFQKKLLHWIKLYSDAAVKIERKEKMLKWLAGNLRQIRQSGLSVWFLIQLQENHLNEIWREVLLKL